MEPFLLLLGGAAAGAAWWLGNWRRVARSRQVVALLYDDQPERFLAEIEKDIAACGPGDVFRICLLVNKSAGLYYVGRFEEAVQLLRELPARRLPRIFQCVYYHNLLTSLLELRRFDEARRIMEENRRLLVPETRVKALNEAIRGSLALFELSCGDRRAGYEALASLARNATTDPGRAFRLFHLGVADLEQGKVEAARHALKMAESLAPNSFVPRAVRALLPAEI
jgi:tetratricopeptide (TPR) repeat protein